MTADAGKSVTKEEQLFIVGRMQTATALWKLVWWFLEKMKDLPQNPAGPLLGMY